MALRPGDGIALEAFLHARGRARSLPVDARAQVIIHEVGSILVVTDLRYRLVSVAVVARDGRCGGSVLVACVGRDEYGDYRRAQNKKPSQVRAQRRRRRLRQQAAAA